MTDSISSETQLTNYLDFIFESSIIPPLTNNLKLNDDNDLKFNQPERVRVPQTVKLECPIFKSPVFSSCCNFNSTNENKAVGIILIYIYISFLNI